MPTFSEHEKVRQHYIPQFWLKRFAGPDDHLRCKKNGRIVLVNTKNIMQEPWLYTLFGHDGSPSNALEEGSSKIEGDAASIFLKLDSAGTRGTEVDQINLRYFICFSALRHPDVLRSGHRLIGRFVDMLAESRGLPMKDLNARLLRFGIGAQDASVFFQVINTISEDELKIQIDDIKSRTGNDPDLPAQMAIHYVTIEMVFFALSKHQITILDCPQGTNYVLGDTPFPATLSPGFTIPLSSSIALHWQPSSGAMLAPWTRRIATQNEVQQSNKAQSDQARELVIGSSDALLSSL